MAALLARCRGPLARCRGSLTAQRPRVGALRALQQQVQVAEPAPDEPSAPTSTAAATAEPRPTPQPQPAAAAAAAHATTSGGHPGPSSPAPGPNHDHHHHQQQHEQQHQQHPDQQPNQQQPNVADLDAQRFRLHPSVAYWSSFSSAINTMWSADSVNLTAPLSDLLRRALDPALLADPRALSYWTFHVARMSFFIGQAAAGVVAHHLSETVPSPLAALAQLSGISGGASSSSSSSSSGGGGGNGEGAQGGAATPATPPTTPFQRLAANAGQELGNRVGEAIATFQQDYQNIRAGYYGLPWDMEPAHAQNHPLTLLRRTSQFLDESVATLRRRVREQPERLWLRSGMYPQYYTKTFHFQTDGWMSDKSARIYEHSTEVLFFGRQDAMQRTCLLPIADWVREVGQAGRRPRDLRLLEVGAGTGRFHTFLKDAYPDMRTVCSDLSPFYLARARANLAHWRALRQPGRYLGGVDETGTEFLQTAAEAIDAPDASFDVVVCVYLFHELPEAIRARAMAEFARVLRPGGLLVLTDSVQLGDRPAWDATIGRFGAFNEPYYASYVSADLGALGEAAGLAPDTKYLCSATKTLAFRKPLA